MTTVRGSVRRITYRNEENHYTVAKIAVDEPGLPGQSAAGEVTLVGYFPSLAAGEWIEAEGEWYVHAEFGRQFKVTSHRKTAPATARGIERYLGSGAVEGIGPKLAKRLVEAFGERTLEIIEKEPHRLLEIEGIGERKKTAISRAIRAEKEVRDALVFLEGYGVTPGMAARVYRRYGPDTIKLVSENPYRLADEVFGIGFKSADAIALEMGVAPDSPERAAAALMHLLNQAAGEGHVFLPKSLLFERAREMEIPAEACAKGLERLLAAGDVVVDPGARVPTAGDSRASAPKAASTTATAAAKTGFAITFQTPSPSGATSPAADETRPEAAAEADEAVYPRFLHVAEVEVARRLARLARPADAAPAPAPRGGSSDESAGRSSGISEDGRSALYGGALFASRTADDEPFADLTPEQRRAVELAVGGEARILVLTGGPGTGKTTALRAMVAALERAGRTYVLAAPTGRAAKRLKEASGKEAKTIHRLLEYVRDGADRPRFQRNERSPLDADVVIVDEASMIDLPLCYHLLRALRPGAKLVLVGDADQLPSVGPGNVLRDVLQSGAAPAVRLTRVFRQASASRIVVNAHRIQQGEMPLLGGDSKDFFFMHVKDPEKAGSLIVDLVSHRLPSYVKCDPLRDVQVLSAVRKGALGVDRLNALIQERLNPSRPGVAEARVGAEAFRPGDRVMQTKNNYDKMVFNGDIGLIQSVDPAQRRIEVAFPERDEPGPVAYEDDEVGQLALAYCTSVHKSQGSEYPAVVMPVHWVMPALMNRNLLYTAVTRARRLVVLVGTEAALRAYIRNDRAVHRYTRLAERLARALDMPVAR
mgnify:CR=1 FL=1